MLSQCWVIFDKPGMAVLLLLHKAAPSVLADNQNGTSY